MANISTNICFCCEGRLYQIFSDCFVTIEECQICRTKNIIYSHLEASSGDYYSCSYFQNSKLVKSLIKTRKRQAELIYSMFVENVDKGDLFVDYGSGYGVFLKHLHSRKYFQTIAIESSEIATSRLRSFTKAYHVKDLKNLFILLKSYDLINYFSALDVIEHFTPTDLKSLFRLLSDPQININKLIIKVPSANGLLLFTAIQLAKLKISKNFLYKILQINSPPPHFTYFSENGLKFFLQKNGFRLYEMTYDADYELWEFGKRITESQGLGNAITFFMYPILAMANLIFPKSKESVIAIAKKIYD